MFVAMAAVLLLLWVSPAEQKHNDFYSFKVINIRGKLVSLEKYRGSVSLVVNVASECGLTENNYKELQQLQRDLGPNHFNVLGFPCNQFGSQEPGSDQEIESFVRKTYKVSFPMFSKIAVKGIGTNAAFKYLIDAFGKEPDWNFWKYLVDVNGKVVSAWGPTVSIEKIKPHITPLVRQLIISRKDEL
ncbi:glutathione peroxidase 7 [Callorhinchus milii]|uniref:Glutathione peroxidase n=2 Tax=Callorhinchus milii TaxID=7868 RepID=V9L8I9_CALMI|nr:glutathione peroxidase 7 [Callorhinchus milii]|eukprot:gi/632963899/ref/XP_007898136.1/ PREDICTED: glutathione peroxidase 7 [Callorhinchus milii]